MILQIVCYSNLCLREEVKWQDNLQAHHWFCRKIAFINTVDRRHATRNIRGTWGQYSICCWLVKSHESPFFPFNSLSSDRFGANLTWWRHQMETFSALLALCVGNSPVTGEFSAQRPVTRNFDIFFDLGLNKYSIVRLVIWDAIAPNMTSR